MTTSIVYYRDDSGCAHFGQLVKRGHKWAHVHVAGAVKRVPLDAVKPWPPVREAAPATPVKRGRA